MKEHNSTFLRHFFLSPFARDFKGIRHQAFRESFFFLQVLFPVQFFVVVIGNTLTLAVLVNGNISNRLFASSILSILVIYKLFHRVGRRILIVRGKLGFSGTEDL